MFFSLSLANANLTHTYTMRTIFRWLKWGLALAGVGSPRLFGYQHVGAHVGGLEHILPPVTSKVFCSPQKCQYEKKTWKILLSTDKC